MSGEVFSRRDVHCAITEKIVAAVEAGAGDYCMPWHRTVTRPVNAFTGKVYHGVNVVALWATAVSRGFRSGQWATYRQWRELDAQVRKGERGAVVVVYKPVQPMKEDQDDDKEKAGQSRLIARASWAFNAEQVDGWTAPIPQPRSEVETRKHVEAFIASTRADIRHGGDIACYYPVGDYIAVPHSEQFVATETSSATESYYSVILHELTHNADIRIMPASVPGSRKRSPSAHGYRHNQRDSRKASSLSSGRYLPGFAAGAVTRARAISLSRKSA
jgi:antirestriction protein ArdC